MRLLMVQIGGDDESTHGWHWSVSDRNKARYFNDLCCLKLIQQPQDEEHHQNHAAKPHRGMTRSIATAAIAGGDAAQEQHDQDDDEYRSKRHGALPELSQVAPKRPAARSKPYSGPRVLAPPKRETPSLRAQRSNPCRNAKKDGLLRRL